MKDIKEFLEARQVSAQHIVTEAKQKYEIHFTTKGALAIYVCELQGQVSDGYWENARPASHWKWVTNTAPVYDKDGNFYTGPHHSPLKYSTAWVLKRVRSAMKNPDSDHGWATRIFNYGKFGSIIPDNKLDEFIKDADNIRGIFEYLPKEKPEDIEKWLDDWTNGRKYREDYVEAIKKFGIEYLDKFYDSKYDMNDFMDDLDAAEEAMNTNKA